VDSLERPGAPDTSEVRVDSKSTDALPIYLKDMSAIPLLGADRERELFERLERAKAGLSDLAEKLPPAYRPAPPPDGVEADQEPGYPASGSLADVERVHDGWERFQREQPDVADRKAALDSRRFRRELDSVKEGWSTSPSATRTTGWPCWI
jgi:hypothetical protein